MGRILQSDVNEPGAGDRCRWVGTRQLHGSSVDVMGSSSDRCLGKVGFVKLIYRLEALRHLCTSIQRQTCSDVLFRRS